MSLQGLLAIHTRSSLPFFCMCSRAVTRSSQPSTSGLGRHFSSPKRPRDKRKTQSLVSIPGQREQHEQYLAQLRDLLENKQPAQEAPSLNVQVPTASEHVNDMLSLQAPPDDPEEIAFTVYTSGDEPQPAELPTKKRRIQPDASTERAYTRWKSVLPNLVTPYLRYHAHTLGKRLEDIPQTLSLCTHAECARKSSRILCLLFDRKSTDNINTDLLV
jgi:hypothetical protein